MQPISFFNNTVPVGLNERHRCIAEKCAIDFFSAFSSNTAALAGPDMSGTVALQKNGEWNFHGSTEGYHIKMMNTTGAGDSFVGALHGIIWEVLKFACAFGAIITTEKGAIPALPTKKEVLTVLKAGK
ncbi:fructokinase-2 [Olea europaea subsp. europaea]|uniref:Fructokinase-2 n=1 Tax=Olea europaea subsp. europaea TaxID=158383 RepID=A0A8S0UYI5_OLEEU|nr:fructokinase-2 [Olea europaea subsp. europaea]